MRHRVELQAPALTPDGGGGAARSYAAYATVWAQVEARAGRSDIAADRRERTRVFRVTIRYRSDVTFATRILYRGAPLEVTDIQTRQEKERFLVLTCEEVRP